MSHFAEYDDFDATGLAELVAKGEVSAETLLDEAIARRDAVNPQINAVIYRMDELARESLRAGLPKGPFTGVPFLIKDLLAAYPGVPMNSGSRVYKDYVPQYESELVKRYRACGLVIFGKTNTPELGIVGTTEPELHGPTRNPWNLELSSGGSSGGSAAAVAAGIVPMASGGDGGGSLRIPGSACGLVGFKATRGRIPYGPMGGDPWYSQVQEGVLSRSVRDTAAIIDAVQGVDIGTPYACPSNKTNFVKAASTKPKKLRIAYCAEPLMIDGEIDAECLAGLQQSIALLRELGHEVVEAMPALNKQHIAQGYLLRMMAAIAGEHQDAEALLNRRVKISEFEPETRALMNLGHAFSAADFDQANRRLYPQVRLFETFMQDYDLFLTPTLSKPPVPLGHFKLKGSEKILAPLAQRLPLGPVLRRMKEGLIQQLAEQNFQWVGATQFFNISGNPSISLPLHWSSDQLPVGMMFTGRFGDDETVFKLAGQLEKAQPWFKQRPPIHAGNFV